LNQSEPIMHPILPNLSLARPPGNIKQWKSNGESSGKRTINLFADFTKQINHHRMFQRNSKPAGVELLKTRFYFVVAFQLCLFLELAKFRKFKMKHERMSSCCEILGFRTQRFALKKLDTFKHVQQFFFCSNIYLDCL
jgi:hypothetical protein